MAPPWLMLGLCEREDEDQDENAIIIIGLGGWGWRRCQEVTVKRRGKWRGSDYTVRSSEIMILPLAMGPTRTKQDRRVGSLSTFYIRDPGEGSMLLAQVG